VGKEHVADLIHRHSQRASNPFIKISCVGFADDVIDSELFGHVRGAFTGASENRVGLLESAHGGTLLIDEIGDMSLTLQAKLLRFLQDGSLRPVGSSKTKHVDVRLLLATRRNLEQLVAGGHFRDDLYYRISDLHILIPPLRDRSEEIPHLAAKFVVQAATEFGLLVPAVSEIQHAVWARMPWPGNVRELRSACRRHTLLGE
jgi:transcriptional regulator with GAF, ATPase, and Fis domain